MAHFPEKIVKIVDNDPGILPFGQDDSVTYSYKGNGAASFVSNLILKVICSKRRRSIPPIRLKK
jgi:hypothetical protein